MKKSVILMILAVYVVAIGVVGFLGIQARMYNETVDVSAIKITAVEYGGRQMEIIESSGVKSVMVLPDSYVEGALFKVIYSIEPNNATDKSVIPEIDQTVNGVTVTEVPGEQAYLIQIDIDQFGGSASPKITLKSVSSNGTIYDSIRLYLVSGN